MKILSHKQFYIVLVSAILTFSCSEDWLEKKRDMGLIVPTTLNDMSLLLHDETNLAVDHANLIELSADDYYVPASMLVTRTAIEQNAYLWAEDIYVGQQNLVEWDRAYYQVEVANVILDGLSKISRTTNPTEWDNVKGGALHLRARALYYLAQTFAPQYDPLTANTDLGIPVRSSADVEAPTVRSSVQVTYDRIIADLEEASRLLKVSPDFISDSSKPAAYGFLARCYLTMGNYEKAFEYSDKYLQIHNDLLDFNSLDPTAAYPIPRYNVEVVQHLQTSLLYGTFLYIRSRVHTSLYSTYADDDLRRVIFYRDMGSGEFGTYAYRGSYAGGNPLFTGISTNEMYLIRAECHARLNRVSEAMSDLNTLLSTRWVTNTYIEFTAANPTEALDIILQERQKELVRRGLRWSDLRRLNKDSNYATKISRVVDGTEYSLEPNDPKYVLPIPDYVIKFSGIEQNPR